MTDAQVLIHVRRNQEGFYDAHLKIHRSGVSRYFQIVWDATTRKAAYDRAKELFLVAIYGDAEGINRASRAKFPTAEAA